MRLILAILNTVLAVLFTFTALFGELTGPGLFVSTLIVVAAAGSAYQLFTIKEAKQNDAK